MQVKTRILKDVSRYIPSSYLSQGVDFITAILVRRFLGPSMMGVWAFCQVLISYAKYASLGVTDATIKEIPYQVAKGDWEKAEGIQNVVFTFTTLTSILLAGGVFAYTWFQRSKFSAELYWGLVTVGAVIVLQRIHNLLVSFLRAHKDFSLISKQIILSSAVNCFLVFLLVSRFQLYGYLGTVVLTYLFNIAYVQMSKRFSLRFSLDKKTIAPILGLGLPLLLSGVLMTFFFSIDKLVISRWLGLQTLGLYSLALMAHNYLFSLPNLIGIVLFPYFQERYGRHESEKELSKYVLTPVTILAGVMPIAIGLTWLSAPLFTAWVLPRFEGGVTALQILILGTFFLSLFYQPLHFLITTKKLRPLILIGTTMVAIGLVLNASVVWMGWGIKGVAGATALSFFIYFSLVFLIVGELYLDRQMSRNAFGRILIIFLYFSTLLLVLSRWLRVPDSPLTTTLCQISLYLIGMFPVVLLVNQKTGLLKELGALLERRGSELSTGDSLQVQEGGV